MSPWRAKLLRVAVHVALAGPCVGAFAQINGMDGGPLPVNAGSAGPASAPLPQSDSPLEKLQAGLSLRPGQMALWNGFASRIDAYVALHLREKPALSNPNETAPRQISSKVGLEQNRLAALEDIEDAARRLYAVLDPAQQRKADELMFAAIPTFAGPPGGAERNPDAHTDRPRRGGGGWGGSAGARSMP